MSKGSRDRTKDHEAYRDSWSKVFGEKREHVDYSQHVMREILPDGSVHEWINYETVRDDDGNVVDIRVLPADYDLDLYHSAEQAAEAARVMRDCPISDRCCWLDPDNSDYCLVCDAMNYGDGDKDQGEPTGLMAYWNNSKTKKD